MRIITFLCTLLIPKITFAGYFSPPPSDKSLSFLGQLFGPVVGSTYLGGNANPALLHMFERFNAIAMILGTIIISYVAIVSTVNTAQEGQVMGRKWNSIWIPMRSLLGLLLLVPGPKSGYSIIQNIVVWCLVQGIGAADNLWNGILDDLNQGLSATQGITTAEHNTHATKVYDALEVIGADVADNLLRSAVCMRSIQKIANGSAKQPPGGFNRPKQNNVAQLGRYIDMYETIHTNNKVFGQQANYTGSIRIGIVDNMDFADICGHYTITGHVNRQDWNNQATDYITDETLYAKAREIYQHKVWAIQLIFQNFLNLANKIVDETVTPRNDNNRLISLPDKAIEPSGYRYAAINTYKEILKHQIKPKHIDSLQKIVRQGKQNGWVSAGSYYFSLNQLQPLEFFPDIMAPITMRSIPRCDDPKGCATYTSHPQILLTENLSQFLQYGPEISFLATRLWDTKILLENDFSHAHATLNLTNNDKHNGHFGKLQHDMLNLLQTMMSEQHVDPLIAQGRFGSSIMVLSEHAWLDPQNELQVLLNRAQQGYTPITQSIMQKIQDLSYKGAVATGVYSIIWVVGAALAIYIPLIPYLIFTICIVGWLLLVVEAVVASPILAISFMIPTHDEMGKMLQGLMLLLNIILRPAMMLFGFIFATRLYQIVVKLVNFGMLTNFDHLNINDSMFAWVAILVIYATFIVSLSNKAFSLIYVIPDKILRWIGGVPEQTDPSQELHFTKSSMQRGAETVNKVSLGIPERGFARSQDQAKQLLSPPDAVRNG